MRISDVVGLFAALIGSTTTLLGAWAYIRSKHPPKGEMLRAALAITLIMMGILGFAAFISRATAININGHDTLPVPALSAPGKVTPVLAPTSTPTLAPTSTSTPTPVSTSEPASTPTPVSTSTPEPASTPVSTSTPAPTVQSH